MMMEKLQPAGASVKISSPPVAVQPPSDSVDFVEEDDEPGSLNDSLPSFSEPVRVSQKKQSSNNARPRLAEVARSLRGSKSNALANTATMLSSVSPPPSAPRPKAQARTTLHQQLIDQTLRHKRQEILSQAFVKWRRGLRIQSQHRQQRAQQFHKLSTKLLGLRRDRMFLQWKALACVRSQVLSCRMDTFQERVASRRLRDVWMQWKFKHVADYGRRRGLLRGAMLRMRMKSTQRALFQWKLHAQLFHSHHQLVRMEQTYQEKWDQRALRAAESHHSKRIQLPIFAKIFRNWRAFAVTQVKKLRVLRKLTMRGATRLKLKGWTQWRATVVLTRQAEILKQEHAARVKGIEAKQNKELQEQSTSAQEAHAQELRELQERLKEKEKELLTHQKRDRIRDKEFQKLQQQLCDNEQRTQKHKQQWSESLEGFFESAVKRVGPFHALLVRYASMGTNSVVVLGALVH